MADYFRIGTIIRASLAALLLGLTSTQAYGIMNPEQMLAQAVAEINAQQQAQALDTLNQLIALYPDFQLAQLMRADILYAQSHLLTKMGQAVDSATVENLQAEANARLSAVKQPPEDKLPSYLLAVPTWLSHIIAVDLSESRAYLFALKQNNMHFVTSFYLTQGKLGAGKEKEGDKRSPIGVYELTAPIPANKLTSFYGAGALPLAYPNTWDKRNNRSGHGIWLHGTPIGQYSRPPKASDGCMVFSNDDLQQIMKTVNWQQTLVVTDNPLKWEGAEAMNEAKDQLQQRLEAWRNAWQNQNSANYLAFYADNFIGGNGENKAAWSERKTQLFSYHRPHQIEISDPLIIRYPGDQGIAITTFNQTYTREGTKTVERKRIWWQWQNDQWRIISEELVS
ncbi:MAG: L,D-transpeptidase family protein [Proteobacteria bacterium]|nr:L,D-transpeptidase family protein [Pseudomonadota bacterium]